MAAALAGDRQALESLLRRHQPRIHALCRRITANAADADDACQEALVAIVRGLGSYDGRAAFSTWVYRLTTNACIDELRRRRRRPEPGLPDDQRESGVEFEDAASVRADVDDALRSVRMEFRAAVVLRDLCGLGYDEIAEVLGVPPGTVRSRIARGRAALLPLLAPAGDPDGNPAPRSERPRE